jgi:hypothetical protein
MVRSPMVATKWQRALAKDLVEGTRQILGQSAPVRSTVWVGDFSRLKSTTWSWWTRPESNRVTE